MSAAKSIKNMPAKVVAPGRSRRLLLICFLAGPDALWDAAQRFMDDISQSFGERVAATYAGPETAPDLSHEFAVTWAVTLVLFVDGDEAARSIGDGGETMLRKMIERHVSSA
jgi:hypothetical protein